MNYEAQYLAPGDLVLLVEHGLLTKPEARALLAKICPILGQLAAANATVEANPQAQVAS